MNGFLFKRLFSQVDSLSKEITCVKKMLHRTTEELPKEYRLKEDCVKERDRIEKIHKEQFDRIRNVEITCEGIKQGAKGACS